MHTFLTGECALCVLFSILNTYLGHMPLYRDMLPCCLLCFLNMSLEYVRLALSVGACDDVAFVDIALTANILVIIVSINTIDTNLFVLSIGITAFLFISCYLSGVFAPCLLYYVIFLC